MSKIIANNNSSLLEDERNLLRQTIGVHESIYKKFNKMILDKQEILNKTPKILIFKKRRIELEQEIEKLSKIKNRHKNIFMEEIKILYDLGNT